MAEPIKTTQTTATPVTPKKVSVWKYRLIIAALILLVILMLGSFGYIGYVGYTQLEDKKKETAKLNDELKKLNEERNVNVVDLQSKLNNEVKEVENLQSQNQTLTAELNAAKAKIDELTPKNIKDLKYKDLIKINSGDTWLEPVYIDVNGDAKLDGIFSYRTSGTGAFLNTYVYSYLDNSLTRILTAEEYQKGSLVYLTDQNVLEIKSQTGTPDAPVTATSRFKWDVGTKRMVKI
jgi:cell division protein FtsB